MRYLQLLRTNAEALQKRSPLQRINASIVESIMRRPIQGARKDLSSVLKGKIIPDLYISDEDFFRIRNIPTGQATAWCWICERSHHEGTAFCKKHFEEWSNQWNISFSDPVNKGLDICQFSYAHVDYTGPRIPFGTRKLVRDWLAC